jgi:AraC family transcriptional regulator of adaptative response/methylated-DNA-[protein]-cysteine methyltransferase
MTTTLAKAAVSQIEFVVLPWSLGWVAVAGAPHRGVRLVHVADDPKQALGGLKSRLRDAELVDADDVVSNWAEKIVAQLENPGDTADVPLDVVGSPFQKLVWDALCAIPPGETLSYAEVASKVGSPKGARAVGLACGSNPLAPMVPCHRVVRSDGSLGGYGFGLDRKRALLEREKPR